MSAKNTPAKNTPAKNTLRLATLAVCLAPFGLAFANAQQPAPAAASPGLTCPLTLDLTYEKVVRPDDGSPDSDIAGFTPSFASATVRLISAQVTGEDTTGDMPDNGDDAKPGQPLVWTIWDKKEKAPYYAAFITCDYEGGYVMQWALPKTTRSCSLQSTEQKPAPTSVSRREIITKAVFTCR